MMIAARVLAACSVLVLTATAHAALTKAERADVRKTIRADAKASGALVGQRPSMKVRFTDNGNGTTTASASTRALQPAWPTFSLVRRGVADATFVVSPSLLTITPAPPPSVTRSTPWAFRMYALGN